MDKRYIAGLGLLFLFTNLPLSAETTFQEGMWEFEISYDFIGVPQHFPSYKVRQCISESAPVPGISREGQNCTEKLQGKFGKLYTWEVNCSNEWEIVQGMGRIKYTGETAQGDVHLQVSNPYNPPQPIVFHLDGKRLGSCDI